MYLGTVTIPAAWVKRMVEKMEGMSELEAQSPMVSYTVMGTD